MSCRTTTASRSPSPYGDRAWFRPATWLSRLSAPRAARKRRASERRLAAGFTLLETMMAIVILSISLLGLAQLMLIALEKHRFSEYTTKAVQVAEGKVEELRNLYNQEVATATAATDLTAGSHGPVTLTFDAPTGTAQGTRSFVVNWEVAALGSGQKQVTVTVREPTTNVLETKTISMLAVFAP